MTSKLLLTAAMTFFVSGAAFAQTNTVNTRGVKATTEMNAQLQANEEQNQVEDEAAHNDHEMEGHSDHDQNTHEDSHEDSHEGIHDDNAHHDDAAPETNEGHGENEAHEDMEHNVH